MKWVFVIAVILITPVLAGLLRSKPRFVTPACFLLGLSLFTIAPILWAAPISWPIWPGPVRGIYVSIIDVFSIALIAATKRVRIPFSAKVAFAIYCTGLLISTLVAEQSLMPIAFYAWQLFRTVLLFIAVSRASGTRPAVSIALVAGMGAGLIYQAATVVIQFAEGVPRPGGAFGNANFLGLSIDYVVFPAAALLLGTRRSVWPGIIGLASIAAAVLGGSRSTLGLIAAGLPLVVVLSIWQQRTARKMAFAAATFLLLAVATPVMLWSAHQRSAEVLESSDQMRSAMKLAASMIIADYPLGIGANEYVVFANGRGYNERAGVAWNEQNRNVPVHDTYYLVAAEMGIIGLVGLIAMLACFVVIGFRTLRRGPLDIEATHLLPGVLTTVIMVSIHIAFEFVTMDMVLHSLFAVAAGLIVGLHAQPRNAARPIPYTSRTGALLPAG